MATATKRRKRVKNVGRTQFRCIDGEMRHSSGQFGWWLAAKSVTDYKEMKANKTKAAKAFAKHVGRTPPTFNTTATAFEIAAEVRPEVRRLGLMEDTPAPKKSPPHPNAPTEEPVQIPALTAPVAQSNGSVESLLSMAEQASVLFTCLADATRAKVKLDSMMAGTKT